MSDDDAAVPRPRKRIRADPSVVKNTPKAHIKEPRLFAPFRALGLITNHVPFVLQTRSHKGSTDGPRMHILTCLGKAWALWEGGKMGLLFVGTCIYLSYNILIEGLISPLNLKAKMRLTQ